MQWPKAVICELISKVRHNYKNYAHNVVLLPSGEVFI